MHSFYAIIIGAGPGGLTCARILSEYGLRVLVLEKKQKIGQKVCGGGITWKGLIQHVPENLIERSFQTQHIRSNCQNITISSSTPIISTVSREKLGQWMYRQAVEKGTIIKTGVSVKEITDRFVVTRESINGNCCFDYHYLIGADGSNSIVRKFLKIDTKRLGIGLHYEVPGNFPRMEWHLNTNLFHNGYAWIFPFKKHASVGVYSDGLSITPKNMQRNLLHWASKNRINLNGLKARAGYINFDYRGWRFGNKLLVGDAAGLASGLTGEGMYPAMVSGETAAFSIINPEYKADKLNRIISKQQKHHRILRLSGKTKSICTITMEMLTLGLRVGLIPFGMLEMADG